MKKLLMFFCLMLTAAVGWAQQDWERQYETRTIVNLKVTVDGQAVATGQQLLIQAIMTKADGGEEVRGECYANNAEYKIDGWPLYYTSLNVFGNSDEEGKTFKLRFWLGGIAFDTKTAIAFDGETQGTLSNMKTYELFDLSKDEAKFKVDDIHTTKDTPVDLNDLVYFKWGGDSVRYLKNLDPAPAYKFNLQGDAYIDVDATVSHSSTISAKRTTTKSGHLYTGQVVVGNGEAPLTKELQAKVFVTPYDRWTNDVTLTLKDVRLDLDDQVHDLSSYIYFNIPKVEGEGYDEVAYADLADTLGDTPEGLSLSLETDGNYFTEALDNQPLKVKLTNRTPRSGVELRVKGSAAGGWDTEAKAKLYIKPFEVFNDSTYITLSNIEVEKNQSVDLREHITFHFPNWEPDPTSLSGDMLTKDVPYADLATVIGYAPTFTLRTAGTPESYEVSNFTLTGKKRTTAPEAITVNLIRNNSNAAALQAEATVTVTLSTTPVEGIAFANVPDPWVAARDSKASVKINVTPEGANYDVEDFDIVVSQNATNLSDTWTLADYAVVQKDDGLYFEITPRVAGITLQVAVSYDDEDAGPSETAADLEVGAQLRTRAGWGWYTLNCLNGRTDIDAVDTDFFDGKLLDVRSQTHNAYKDPTYGFFGNLSVLDPYTAYRIKTTATQAADVTFQSDKIQEVLTGNHSFNLSKGYNWVPYRYQYARTLTELLGQGLDFSGRIISKDNGFAENNGTGWVGTLTTLQPGESYLIFRESEESAYITMNAENMLTQPAAPTAQPTAARGVRQWQYNAADFAGNMTIVAELANVPDAEDMTIGAFVGGECRGEGQCVTDAEGHQYMFITVHGEGNEVVDFVLSYNGQEYLLNESLPFSTGVGSLDAPVRIIVPGVVPTAIPMTRTTAPADYPVYDLSGRRVSADSHGITISGGKTVMK